VSVRLKTCAIDLDLVSDLREAPTITQRNAKSRRQNDAWSDPSPLQTPLQFVNFWSSFQVPNARISPAGVVYHDSGFWHSAFQMARARRSDGTLTDQPSQSSKVLTAPADALDPALASLFASSVGCSFVLPTGSSEN